MSNSIEKEPLSFNDKKVIIISDTHIGSIFESLSYLDSVFEYAIKHNINNIFHTGDLIQSTYRNANKKYYNEEKQITHLLNIYPYDQSITTHLLYGNHDYHTIKKNQKYHEMIISRRDFNYLGTKTVYLKINGVVVSLHHHCPSYNITIPNIKPFISFCGHSHHFALHKNGKVLVPALCDDLKDNSSPGFLIMTISNKSLYLELVKISPKLIPPTLVLKKARDNGILN